MVVMILGLTNYGPIALALLLCSLKFLGPTMLWPHNLGLRQLGPYECLAPLFWPLLFGLNMGEKVDVPLSVCVLCYVLKLWKKDEFYKIWFMKGRILGKGISSSRCFPWSFLMFYWFLYFQKLQNLFHCPRTY